MQVILDDLEVMYVEAIGGVSGSKEAFAQLESRLPSLKGRRFYGTLQNERYRACVAPTGDDDPAAMGLHTWVVPGGQYVRSTIKNWPEHLEDIAPTFQAMAAEHVVDPERPSIEFYRSQKELLLLLPIK